MIYGSNPPPGGGWGVPGPFTLTVYSVNFQDGNKIKKKLHNAVTQGQKCDRNCEQYF